MDKTGQTYRSRRVGILLIDGFALMSYASVVRLYRIVNIPASGAAATSSGGAIIPAGDSVGAGAEFDLVLIAAGGDPATYHDAHTFDWLRALARRGITLGGVSGGPVILASAGLMKGRRMTVHWEHAAALTEISPTLLVERSLYVIDRDRVTCAGGTAPMDLMHALIAEHHGPDLARRVSDWFMHTEIRLSGDPQRAGRAARYQTTDPAVLRAIEAMENHVADPLELRQLASIAGVSLRQLNRLFRNTTMRFYRRLRLEKGRSLLTNSSLRITEIALATGFANSGHFSTAFLERYGSTPSSCR
jgi:transcriptional regulator GlxA family with amidase domain